jgi:hypothetical protein
MHFFYRFSLCTCEKAAENGALSTTPQPARSGRFNLFLGSDGPSAQRASTADFVAHVFDIHSHSPSPPLPPGHPVLRGTYFGSTGSVPKMDPSLSTLRIMARGIYSTVLPTALRPCLPCPSSPSNLRRLLSFQADARFKL